MKRILIVDDDPGHRLLMKRALKDRTDISLDEAEGCKQAHERLGILPRPALVLLDLNLSGESGLELLTRLRATLSLEEFPVAIISTSPLLSDIEAAYAAGANCYLAKAEEPAEFLLQISCAVRFFIP